MKLQPTKCMIAICAILLFAIPSLAQRVHQELKEYQSLRLQIKYGTDLYELAPGKIVPGNHAVQVDYSCPGMKWLKVSVTSVLCKATAGKVVSHKVSISSVQKPDRDLTFYFPVNTASDTLWYPLKSGVGKSIPSPGKNNGAVYRCAGKWDKQEHDLAIPLAVYSRDGGNAAVMTDPYFSSTFRNGYVYWTYAKEVGLEDAVEERTIVEAFNTGTPDDIIGVYYKEVLKDIPAGPRWLKDIAMVSYDYMSDSGRGWFNDIDSLVKIVPVADRSKILLNLHGWYDYVGRYCFNAKTGKLDREWHSRLMKGTITMSDLHRRIAYAKDRGFKVALYFADGIISGDKLDDYAADKTIEGGGWSGPDVLGNTYRRNIATREYYDFYRNYATALFAEFGKEADMFVWDETFYITAGHLGTEKHRAYLDRTFMRLVKEITAKLHEVNPDAAFMTSDLIGPENYSFAAFADVPPYSLVADGTYQDSHCGPEFWSYGIFPNYRNVLWSCNWSSLSRFDYTMFGVMQYQAPVVFTNGWEDDKGFSELTAEDKHRLIRLFNYRKSFSTSLKWFEVLPPYIPTCK